MKGHNSITLCPLQMQQIVQEWIDRNIASKPKVTTVASESRDEGFKIGLKENEAKD